MDVLGDPAADLILIGSAGIHPLCELGLILSQPNLGLCWYAFRCIMAIVSKTLAAFCPQSMSTKVVIDIVGYDTWPALAVLEE